MAIPTLAAPRKISTAVISKTTRVSVPSALAAIWSWIGPFAVLKTSTATTNASSDASRPAWPLSSLTRSKYGGGSKGFGCVHSCDVLVEAGGLGAVCSRSGTPRRYQKPYLQHVRARQRPLVRETQIAARSDRGGDRGVLAYRRCACGADVQRDRGGGHSAIPDRKSTRLN